MKVGILTNTSVFSIVANAQNRRKNSVDSDHIATSALCAGLLDAKVATASIDNHIHVQSELWIIDCTDNLLWIGDFDSGWKGDITSFYNTRTFLLEMDLDRLIGVGLQMNVFKIQDDVNGIFYDTWNR